MCYSLVHILVSALTDQAGAVNEESRAAMGVQETVFVGVLAELDQDEVERIAQQRYDELVAAGERVGDREQFVDDVLYGGGKWWAADGSPEFLYSGLSDEWYIGFGLQNVSDSPKSLVKTVVDMSTVRAWCSAYSMSMSRFGYGAVTIFS